MAFFRVPVSDGVPRFADMPCAAWRISPGGDEAILEFEGTESDYAQVRADPDSSELTKEAAQQLAREWDAAVWGGAA
jgi:hypothetical protein